MSEKEGKPFGRPRSKDIKSSENPPSKPEKIRRIAQPGNVLLPRAVAYRTGLSMAAKLVAMWLYDHLKPGSNTATGSQELIAEELDIWARTVRTAVSELWEKDIIMKIEKHPKEGGGYYLSYDMRVFSSDKPRAKPHPRYKTDDKPTKSSKSSTEQPKSSPAKPNPECPLCYGSGWDTVTIPKFAQHCGCKK